ncbi:uncharacterized protein LOC106082679 [Stomoxys calcitrans]|uniref:uncharacterized protein LOC106082679 n=1 Tax=Stomoxys calcitrans TaxID=35570 RepID=UPI0027E2FBCD|nr:uncharacterized protein LOC106082679 [Stomoxys calcitrans]
MYKVSNEPKVERKFCRACLTEIRSLTQATNFMQPPQPPVSLRDNVKAKSYLECYYFCLKSNCNRFSITYLPDHSYICHPCKNHMLNTVEFITKSQKNEEILKAMYDEDEDDGIARTTSSRNELSGTIKIISPADLMERYEEVDLQDTQITEIETTECEEIPIEVCSLDQNIVIHKNNNAKVVVLEQVRPAIQVIVPQQNIYNKQDVTTPRENQRVTNTMAPGQTPRYRFNCVICKESFQFQRQLYEHYDDKHDQKLFSFNCDVCNRLYITQKALTFHQHSIHNGIEYVDCDLCGQLIFPEVYDDHRERHKAEYTSHRGGCG